MTKLPRITAREMIAALKRAGWEESRTKGSHVHMTHKKKSGRVTVPNHAGMTLKPRVVAWILEQAGMTVDDLVDLL